MTWLEHLTCSLKGFNSNTVDCPSAPHCLQLKTLRFTQRPLWLSLGNQRLDSMSPCFNCLILFYSSIVCSCFYMMLELICAQETLRGHRVIHISNKKTKYVETFLNKNTLNAICIFFFKIGFVSNSSSWMFFDRNTTDYAANTLFEGLHGRATCKMGLVHINIM